MQKKLSLKNNLIILIKLKCQILILGININFVLLFVSVGRAKRSFLIFHIKAFYRLHIIFNLFWNKRLSQLFPS